MKTTMTILGCEAIVGEVCLQVFTASPMDLSHMATKTPDRLASGTSNFGISTPQLCHP
jgi:hypothetical protein